MLTVAARIPEAAARDQFADRIAHKARITEEVVRAEIRKAAVSRRTTVTARELPGGGQLKAAERGLIWGLFHKTEEARAALAGARFGRPGAAGGPGGLRAGPVSARPAGGSSTFRAVAASEDNERSAGHGHRGRARGARHRPRGSDRMRPHPETTALRARTCRHPARNRPAAGARIGPAR